MAEMSSLQKRRVLNYLLRVANYWAFKGSYHPSEWNECDRLYLTAINNAERALGLPLSKKPPKT